MKDAGCSSNAARVFQLFGGDDQTAKRGLWERDWRKWGEMISYALEYIEPEGPPLERLHHLGALVLASSQRELFEIRCDSGADIARALGVSEPTALAIRAMDEHWDGGGYPTGLRHDEIPLCARIMATADIFDALSATRPYRDAIPINQVLSTIGEGRGTQLCPTTVDALLSVTSRTRGDLTPPD